MANETQIIVNKRSIRFIDTTTKQEYFSTFIDHLRWKRDKDDNFTFFNSVPIINNGGNENINQLGVLRDITGEQVGVSSFVYTTTLNPDTGLHFITPDLMETWLGNNTGFYFDPNPIGVVVDITGVLTSVAHDATLTGDGTVGDPLSVVSTGVVFTPTINSTNMVEVSQESDFGTPSVGVITLTANTTYFVRGNVAITNELLVSSGNAIVGFNRDIDKLTYSGSTNLITVVDNDFSMRNIGLCSTNATGKLLDATNITVATPNYYGRTKVLELQNLKIEDTTNIWTIRGFELVDLSNCLFWFISDGTIGCQFQSCRHLEISSCEFYNWYNRTTPANLDFYRQIEILADYIPAVGNGVININSSICHPETIQEGVYVNSASTTGFGTISSNTFTDTNLTTGFVLVLDYDVQNTYIIQANQGILNGNAKGTLSIIDNLNDLDTGTTNPQVLNEANVGGSFTNTPTFPVSNRVTTSVPNCSFTYNNKNNGNFFVVITGTVEMSGDGFIACRVRSNGVAIPFAFGYPEIRQGRAQNFSFSVIGSAVIGDVFDVEFESFNTSGVSNPNDILVREFVLNGYQF